MRVAHAPALLLLWVIVVVKLWRSFAHPWDFETYYYAALALRKGLDPYRLHDLFRLSGHRVELPFLYPPLALLLFVPFTWLKLSAAVVVWDGIKLAVLAALLGLWRKTFARGIDLLLLSAVLVVGFDGALVWDLRSGNVSLLEVFLLWSAFACHAADRRKAFTALIVLASIWKLTPAVFLVLLLVPSKRRASNPWLLTAGMASVAALAFLPVALGPAWTHGFFSALPEQRPSGRINPCALGIIDSLSGQHGAPLWGPPLFPGGWWLAFDAAVVASSWPLLRRTWAARDPRSAILVAVILYALLAPRMVIYSYVSLVVPMLALGACWLGRAALVAVVALIVAPGTVALLGFRSHTLVGDNTPFLIVLIFWLAIVVATLRTQRAPSGDDRLLVPV